MALTMREAARKCSSRPLRKVVARAIAFTSFFLMMILDVTLIVAWSTPSQTLHKKPFHAESIRVQSMRLPADGKNTFQRGIFPLRIINSIQLHSSSMDIEKDNAAFASNAGALLEVEAHSGLSNEEFSLLISTVEAAYAETVGLAGVSCTAAYSPAKSAEKDHNNDLLVGTLGRVLGIKTNLDEESAECLRALIAQQMDHFIYESGELKQPVLVSVRTPADEQTETTVEAILQKEIEQYGLRTPVHSESKSVEKDDELAVYTPSFRIEMDGAETLIDEDSGETFWDTSSVVVFDQLVGDDLRGRLLEVVKGKPSVDNDWDDVENGPDPNRWIKGGLRDIPDNEEEINNQALSCWGLPTEAIEDICLGEHEAIKEFESKLTNLFPQFLVSRLPEAVYGECVSPLTANAPVAGEENLYDYHIDGDPLQTPPSPWTDVYGRYPNRSRGKPRFVSCILYLNDEWDGEQWGAPTKFYDPPTGKSCEVLPLPGRCVFLDQDLGHTVTPPKASAGKRPRYSLVWKLILHPKTEHQDMTKLSGFSDSWPEPELFGSAAAIPPSQ